MWASKHNFQCLLPPPRPLKKKKRGAWCQRWKVVSQNVPVSFREPSYADIMFKRRRPDPEKNKT